MKILFLDVDGVLNSRESLSKGHPKRGYKGVMGIDPFMCILVHRIVEKTGCKVVLSSSWRHSARDVEELEDAGFEFLDKTPVCDTGFRGDEINLWLDTHEDWGIENYAILDDDSDFHPDQHLFKTSFETGITQEIVEEVIDHLGCLEK